MDLPDVRKLAQLARVTVPETELERVGHDIGAILNFVATVRSRNIDEVTVRPDKVNVFREDAVAPLLATHDLVEAAPQHQDRFVKVPKVIE